MYTPQFSKNQFLSSTILNQQAAVVTQTQLDNINAFFTPGLLSAASATHGVSGLTAAFTFTYPFAALFSGGPNNSLAFAQGDANNLSPPYYQISLAAYVPTSGTQEAYVYIQPYTVQQNPVTIVGPPEGHPSWNPGFIPFTGYTKSTDSFQIGAGLFVPNGALEICRVQLSAGQTVLANVDYSHQVLATVQTGYPPGTYANVVLTVDGNGRATISSAPVGSFYSGFSTGAQNWVVPTNVYRIKIRLWGGGGGGGGANANTGGCGGCGGGYAETILSVTPGQTYIYNITAGGNGGALGFAGQVGGTATFSGNGITITATGGGGGPANSNPQSNQGGFGTFSGCTGLAQYGGEGLTGVPTYNGTAVNWLGGAGGAAGGGGGPGAQTSAGPGSNAGFTPGGGGGGAGASTGTGYAGGNGANGGMYIEWGF